MRLAASIPWRFTCLLYTSEALAFESKVSESTIGRYRNGKVESFSEKNVVALCVATVSYTHLPQAQRRFVKYLLKLSRVKKLQIILSTHSPFAVSYTHLGVHTSNRWKS